MPSRAELAWQTWTNTAARQTSLRVSAAYIRYATGDLTLEECIGVQAAQIAIASRRAVTFNDLLLAAELTQALEAEYNAVGIAWMETPDEQAARLSKGLATVIGDDVAYVGKAKTPEQAKQLAARSIRSRLDRLTTGEVVEASQWSRQTAMQAWEGEGVIAGWYRRLSPRACDWCRTVGGNPTDKFIHPVTARMPVHLHCTCSQGWVSEVEPWHKWVGPTQHMKAISEPAAQ